MTCLAGVLEQIASKEAKIDHETVMEETTSVCFSIVAGLLEKTGIHPSEVYSLICLFEQSNPHLTVLVPQYMHWQTFPHDNLSTCTAEIGSLLKFQALDQHQALLLKIMYGKRRQSRLLLEGDMLPRLPACRKN